MVESSKKTIAQIPTKNSTTTSKKVTVTPGAAKTTPGATKATPGARKDIAGLNNHECSVCLELCAQPVKLPCKHAVCFDCSKRITEMGMTCPLCRAHFDKLFIPVVDKALQEQIALEAGYQFEERKAQLVGQGKWVGSKRLLRFAFGNTHEDVINPKPANSDKTLKNSHRWAMFVAFNDNADITSKYIKSVTYHLHPTFHVNKIKVTEAPFLLSRVGWGWFTVEFDIEFQPWTKLPTMRMEHDLCFNNKGHTQSIMLEVED